MSQFGDKSHARVTAITKRISLNLRQPPHRKLWKSRLEPYNARSCHERHGMGGAPARTSDESQTLDDQWQRQVRDTVPTLRLCCGLVVQTG
jgi:hypothetical protein